MSSANASPAKDLSRKENFSSTRKANVDVREACGAPPTPHPLVEGPGCKFGLSVSPCATEQSGIYQGSGDTPETGEKPNP